MALRNSLSSAVLLAGVFFLSACTSSGAPMASAPTVLSLDASIDGEGMVSSHGVGYVEDDGGLKILVRGVCWATTENPTIDGDCTADGRGTGSFSSAIMGLSPTTVYHLRAYATNALGTGYGEDLVFTTGDGSGEPVGDDSAAPNGGREMTVVGESSLMDVLIAVGPREFRDEVERCLRGQWTSRLGFSIVAFGACETHGGYRDGKTYRGRFGINAAIGTVAEFDVYVGTLSQGGLDVWKFSFTCPGGVFAPVNASETGTLTFGVGPGNGTYIPVVAGQWLGDINSGALGPGKVTISRGFSGPRVQVPEHVSVWSGRCYGDRCM